MRQELYPKKIQKLGQSFTLAHLAPFVDVSRKKLLAQVRDEMSEIPGVTEEQIRHITEKRLRDEIRAGIQTIQYQLITLMTCNGQAPFVTMFMYLDEVPEGQTRDDLASIIHEVLTQRIKGVKNEVGAWITPAFPKLIYVLDEDNVRPGSKYYDLTELAAKCTAKRMVPDYISAKIMQECKNGDTYPAMGCRSFLTPDDGSIGNVSKAQNYTSGQHKYYGRSTNIRVSLNDVNARQSGVAALCGG